MNYVGVDVGKGRHAAAAVDETGGCVMPPRFFTQDAGGFASLSGALAEFGGAAAVVVGMEATGHYWKALRHTLAQRGYRVDVINPLVTAREASSDVRGRKTDKLDALAIANVTRKGGYSPAPAEEAGAEVLKALARQRRHLVARRSAAKCRLTSTLDVIFPEAVEALGDLYAVSSLAVVAAFPSARLAATADIRTLSSRFAKASGGQLGREAAKAFRAAARHSVSLTLSNEGEEFVAAQTVEEIRTLDAQIGAVERRILAEPPPPAARILTSIKGAGKIQPMAAAAELGDLSRFAGADMAKKVLAYAGCEPRVRESGAWKGRAKMSKRGSPSLRHALYLMAHTIRLHSPFFNEIYKRHVAKGKHHNVALSHVVRKLVEVMCGMYKTNTLFVPPLTEPAPCS
jgi:transposase